MRAILHRAQKDSTCFADITVLAQISASAVSSVRVFQFGSVRLLSAGLGCGAVIVSDTFGRPWREGLVNVAIGVAGLSPLADLRRTRDWTGKPLQSTTIAVADELAAAAGLVMPKAAGVPVALITGFDWARSDGSARSLVRASETDLFR